MRLYLLPRRRGWRNPQLGTPVMRTTDAYGKFETAFRGRNEMDQQQPVQGQVQIKADERELQGQYSNLVITARKENC